jgi:hypothetical protein
VKPPCVAERPGAKRGGINRTVCNVSEARASVVTRIRREAGEEGAEPVRPRRRPRKAQFVQERALRNPPAYWALNVRMVVLGTRESRLGPGACGAAGSDAPPITGEPGKWWAAERQSERVLVVLIGGTTQPARSEGPALHRCTEGAEGT